MEIWGKINQEKISEIGADVMLGFCRGSKERGKFLTYLTCMLQFWEEKVPTIR